MTLSELQRQFDNISLSLEQKARDTLSAFPPDSEIKSAISQVYEDIGREIGTLTSIIIEYEKSKN